MHEAATMLMRSFGRAGRALPAIKRRGRLAIALTSIVVFRVTAGHFIAANTMTRNGRRCSPSCALARGARCRCQHWLSYFPMAAFARSIGAKVVAIEPVAVNTQWLLHRASRQCYEPTPLQRPRSIFKVDGWAKLSQAQTKLPQQRMQPLIVRLFLQPC
jgi:hypothetical protein